MGKGEKLRFGEIRIEFFWKGKLIHREGVLGSEALYDELREVLLKQR